MNKEKTKEYHKQYRKDNKEKILKYQKEFRKNPKNRHAHKMVYCLTEETINTSIEIIYNPKTDRITFAQSRYRLSHNNTGASKTNKQSSLYLGVTVAESVLSKIFKNVEVMRNGNPGYDFKCNHGYLIDVKSSTKMKNQKAWYFNINRNLIADHFLCLAFDNRDNLKPEHIWLIPGKQINHLTGLQIFKSKLSKWNQYELTDKLNDIITCCNTLRGD